MLKAILGAVVGAVVLAGCASVPMASKTEDAALKSFSKPSSEKAGIYIYRDTFAGQALRKNLYVDGVLLGESANKVYFYEEVIPGIHKISTESEFSDNEIDLKTEGGKNYFVEQYIKFGVFVGGANLKVVSESQGKKAVQSCSLAKSRSGNSIKSARTESTRSEPSAVTSLAANSTPENVKYLYQAEKLSAQQGCASTSFVSSGPGMELYTAQCNAGAVSIRCDFGQCAMQ